MSIYRKLAEIQYNLIGKFEKNSTGFHNAKYYNLEELISKIFPECYKKEVTLYFTFTNDEGILHLKSWNKEGEVGVRDEMSVRAPLPENKGDAKNIGGIMTYTKRYLLMNLFLSTETDYIEEGYKEDSKKIATKKAPKKTAKPKEETSEGKPGYLKNAVNLAKKKHDKVTAEEVKEEAEGLMNKGIIDLSEFKKITDYVDTHGVKV